MRVLARRGAPGAPPRSARNKPAHQPAPVCVGAAAGAPSLARAAREKAWRGGGARPRKGGPAAGRRRRERFARGAGRGARPRRRGRPGKRGVCMIGPCARAAARRGGDGPAGAARCVAGDALGGEPPRTRGARAGGHGRGGCVQAEAAARMERSGGAGAAARLKSAGRVPGARTQASARRASGPPAVLQCVRLIAAGRSRARVREQHAAVRQSQERGSGGGRARRPGSGCRGASGRSGLDKSIAVGRNRKAAEVRGSAVGRGAWRGGLTCRGDGGAASGAGQGAVGRGGAWRGARPRWVRRVGVRAAG